MLCFGALGELPTGTSPDTPPVVAVGDAPLVLDALRQFLIAVLPSDVEAVQGQGNRVPEPKSATFVVLTPIRRERYATNVDAYVDCRFTGSIGGSTMVVTSVDFGSIPDGAAISGVGVLPGTKIVGPGGGVGAYSIAPDQNVSSRVLAAGVAELKQTAVVTVQLDVHGVSQAYLGEIVATITTAIRDDYAVEWFAENFPGVTPLYADDGSQVPFVNAEDQYEDRWVIEARLEIDPTIVLSQQFADQVVVTPVPADVLYKAM